MARCHARATHGARDRGRFARSPPGMVIAGSCTVELPEPCAMSTARFDEIYRAHHPFLRRLAARLCGSTFEPDDLVQDVLERCVVHTGALLSADNHQSWMARVMRNLFVDRLRRRAAAPSPVPLEDQLAMPVYEPPPWWEAIDREELRTQTSRLPQTLRTPFELFAFHGRTYQQIADELGITQLTVGTRLLRARRCLRDLLSEAHAAQRMAVIATR